MIAEIGDRQKINCVIGSSKFPVNYKNISILHYYIRDDGYIYHL